MSKKAAKKQQFNIRMPLSLLNWAKVYAAAHHTSVTQIIIDHLAALKERETNVQQI